MCRRRKRQKQAIAGFKNVREEVSEIGTLILILVLILISVLGDVLWLVLN